MAKVIFSSDINCTCWGDCPRNQPSGRRFKGVKKCRGCPYARVDGTPYK